MYSFNDKTYCASPNCKNECGRKLTPEIWDAAKKAGMMVAQSYFCGSLVPEVTVQSAKEWVQHRIDYWEDQAEKAPEDNTHDEAVLNTYYEVMEFLTGQRQ